MTPPCYATVSVTLATIIKHPVHNKFLTNSGYIFSPPEAFHLQTGPCHEAEEYTPHALPSLTPKKHFNIIPNHHTWRNQPNFMHASPQTTHNLFVVPMAFPQVTRHFFSNTVQYTGPSLFAGVRFLDAARKAKFRE